MDPIPPETGPFRAFAYAAAISGKPMWYTGDSRYLLYDNGSFTLRYPHVQYRGTYAEADGVITFAWSGARSWGATGTLTDDSLTVRYNADMVMSDFEDAVYHRTD